MGLRAQESSLDTQILYSIEQSAAYKPLSGSRPFSSFFLLSFPLNQEDYNLQH